MAIEERQFESEFGFKSPGFTVDKLGNITATSINAAGAGGGGVAAIIASPEKHNQIKHTINQQSPFQNGEFINYAFS